MQHPKMIVLGLIGMGLEYGFQMEAFVDDTDMRQWAKIGMSTIYKTLKDLTREGAVAANRRKSDKGPARIAYRLTPVGRAMLRDEINAALRAETSVYSDRIAGLVFAPLLGEDAGPALSASIDGLQGADAALQAAMAERQGDVVAEAVLTYYREIYAAERKALAHLRDALAAGRRPGPAAR